MLKANTFKLNDQITPPHKQSTQKTQEPDQIQLQTQNLKILGTAIEIIKGKLYWISDVKPPCGIPNSFFFSICNELQYQSFNQDFGPLNLSMVHRYCVELKKLLDQNQFKAHGVKIYHYTKSSQNNINLTNSAFLIGAFMIIMLNQSAEQAWKELAPYHSVMRAYRDAGKGDCDYKCTVQHCLQGVEFAIKNSWYSFQNFSVKEYQHYEKVQNGDLNWIIPGKFIAHMGPVDKQPGEQRQFGHSVSSYLNIFKHLKVSKVIRLNEPKYEESVLTRNGIEHEEMYFNDGSVPPDEVAQKFIQSCENHFQKPDSGAIAVHCKAGLGRTGTLIGIYAIKHYQISAQAFIGWIRIARPGSVLGPQQYWLCQQQSKFLNHCQEVEMSPADKIKYKDGELNQANYLLQAKERNSEKKPNFLKAC